MTSSITVKYQLTRSMAEEALRQFGSRKAGGRLWIMAVFLWLVLTLSFSAVLRRTLMEEGSPAEQWAVAAAVSTAFIGVWVRSARKAVGAVEPQEITLVFSDLGVDKRTLHAETKLDWKAFRKVVETRKYFFLCYSNNTVDIVPKEAFVSPQDADAFKTLVSSRVPGANGFP